MLAVGLGLSTLFLWRASPALAAMDALEAVDPEFGPVADAVRRRGGWLLPIERLGLRMVLEAHRPDLALLPRPGESERDQGTRLLCALDAWTPYIPEMKSEAQAWRQELQYEQAQDREQVCSRVVQLRQKFRHVLL